MILGTGNIGTDLMAKLLRSEVLEIAGVVGIDPASEGLARAREAGLVASAEGIDWLLAAASPSTIVFDATSAAAHRVHAPRLAEAGLRSIDLTPAKLGPSVVPVVNLDDHLDAGEINLITCGGQATIPIVAAVARVTDVPYAEMISAVASASAGPGTRANIDEFTRATARGLEEIGGAARGKAIIVLNPADPPILMRNTVFCALGTDVDQAAVVRSIETMVAEVATYVPGYRLTTEPVFDDGRVSVFLEVTGAGDFLPAYAGNLDIMTAAAVRVGEELARASLVAGDVTAAPTLEGVS
ncbi:MAG TPA: acetaldehyde dehydrogenase (acetylating) [Acidimicrobiia bacterium]|nr:acetaldehyde dehydrogenase (acetylating) [Acidimicrobiia bacterium]